MLRSAFKAYTAANLKELMMCSHKAKSVALLATLITFTGCKPDTQFGDIRFEEETVASQAIQAPPKVEPIKQITQEVIHEDPEVAEVMTTCEQAKAANQILVKHITVDFPKTYNCSFNEKGESSRDINELGNGPRIDFKVMARTEQSFVAELPADATICDMDFDFPEQTMEYDDEILLTLGGKVLFMSTDYSQMSSYKQYQQNGLAVNKEGQVQYKWMGANALYNLNYNHNLADQYCYGIPKDSEGCQIPRTEELGQIKLDIPKEKIIALKNGPRMNFNFITTGDNNDGDCEHSDFSFEIEVKYINQNQYE